MKIKSFGRERLDIMRVQVTHTKKCEVMDCVMGSKSEVWERWKDEWCGEEGMRKAREGERKGMHS